MAVDCSSLVLVPQILSCSGHGTCMNATNAGPRCICDAPWTSQGDFRYELGLDCDVLPAAITGIYSVSLTNVVATLLCLWNMRVFIRMQERPSKRCRGPILTHLLILCTALFHSAFDILKIIEPVAFSVGTDLTASWVMGFANLFLFLFGAHMTNGIIDISLRQSKFTGRQSTKTLLLVLRIMIPFLLVTLSTCHILATIAGFYAPQYGQIFLFTSVIGSNIAFVSFAFFVPAALGHILRDMENLIDQAKQTSAPLSPMLVSIHGKLKSLRWQFFIQPINNGIINFIIALWPFMLRKYCYIFAIFQTTMPILLIISLRSLTKFHVQDASEPLDGSRKPGKIQVHEESLTFPIGKDVDIKV